MKRLYYIATLAIALFASLPIQAQEEAGNTQQQQQRRRGPEASRGAREEEKKENGMPELTVRAQDILSHPTDERADELVLDHLPAGMRRQVVRL